MKPIHYLRNAARSFRDRATILLLLVMLALVIISSAFQALNIRVINLLNDTKGEVLGADVIISSKKPFGKDTINTINHKVNSYSYKINYKTVLQSKDNISLTDVKAIDDSFPLNGEIVIKDNSGKLHKVTGHPESNKIWLDKRAMDALKVTSGDIININNNNYIVDAEIVLLPEKIGIGAISPKLVINSKHVADIISSQGARAKYELLLNGQKEVLDTLISEMFPNTEYKITRAQDGGAVTNAMIHSVSRILNLAFMVQVIVCLCTLVYSLRYFCLANTDSVVTFKLLGLSKKSISIYYYITGIIITIFSLFFGYKIGTYIEARLSSEWLSSDVTMIVNSADVVTLGITLLIFYMFFINRLVHGVDILVRDDKYKGGTSMFLLLVCIVGVIIKYLGQDHDLLRIFIGLSCITMLLYIFFTTLYGKISKLFKKHPWYVRFALVQIGRNKSDYAVLSTLLIIILSLCSSIYFINSSLIDSWRNQFSNNMPNYFVIDVPKSDCDKFINVFKKENINSPDIYPSVTAELTKIGKDKLVHPSSGRTGRKGFHRGLKVTYMEELKDDNIIIDGQWLDNNKNEISVEEAFANKLGIHIGDLLTLDVGSKELTGIVTSIRTLNWQDMTPNFFLILSKSMFEDIPYTYMTSFYLNEKQESVLLDLSNDFPMTSIFDTKMIIEGVTAIISKLTLFTYSFMGILSALLFIAFIFILMCQFRTYSKDWTLLKLIGIDYKYFKKYLVFEYCSLGVIVGVFSSFLGTFIAAITLRNGFKSSLAANLAYSNIILFIFIFIFSFLLGLGISRYIMNRLNFIQES